MHLSLFADVLLVKCGVGKFRCLRLQLFLKWPLIFEICLNLKPAYLKPETIPKKYPRPFICILHLVSILTLLRSCFILYLIKPPQSAQFYP